MPRDVLESMPFSKGMGFYSALQSPNDINSWVFIERNIENTSYNFCSFDFGTRTKKILFSENESPNPNYAFNPFAWSKLKDEIYIEALVFGSATENEGIWSYNFSTKKFTNLLVSKSYLTTPIISEDSKSLIYTGTLEQSKSMHSQSNIVFLYDIQKNQEMIIANNSTSWFFVEGWIDENILNSDLIDIDKPDITSKRGSIKNLRVSSVQQLPFKLPWASGQSYCVNRTGSGTNFTFPTTCGSSACSIVHSGDHGYEAIDFDLSTGTNVLAVAGGTVVFAWFNVSSDGSPGGYGNLVKIKHSDNTYAYYAHLNQIGVKVGDVVAQGRILGKSGTTGHSTGPHLHFEIRDSGDARYTTNSGWPIFSEYGCTPNQNKQYTSQNIQQTGTSNFSLNTSNALTIACNSTRNDATGGKPTSLNNVTTGDYSNVSSNPYNGWNDPGPEKVYKITVSSGATLTATLSNLPSGLDLDIFILNSNGGNAGNVTVNSSSATLTNATAGEYYILVDGSGSQYFETDAYGHYGSFTLTTTCSGGGVPTATITNVTFPSSVNSGSTFTLSYSINATGSFNNNILLGASIRRNSIDYSNSANDNLVSLVSGTNTKTRSFNLSSATPNPVPDGVYDVIVDLWKDNNGNGIIDGSDTQLSPVTYSQQLTITTSPACTSPTATVNSPSGSSPLTMTCTASGGSGGAIAYKWFSGNACSGTVLGTNATLSVTASGVYSCKAYITGFEGTCSVCATGTATITNTCSSPTATVNSPSGSSPLTMTCTASGGSGGTIAYKWYSGNACSGTVLGTNATLSVTASGVYSCKAYITGFEGTCSVCATGTATITNTCSSPTATVNSPSGSSPLTMTCTASGGSGGAIAYKWYSGNACSGTVLGTNATLSVTASGVYSCKVYITGFEGTCSVCATGTATINGGGTPQNDLCAGAIPISCSQTVSGSTTNATANDNPGTCVAPLNTSPGIWYKFIGNGNTITISTCSVNTNFDTVIGLFSGSCGNLTCIAGNDDDPNCGTQSTISGISTVSGTTYYIYVTGFDTYTGNFDLNISYQSGGQVCTNWAVTPNTQSVPSTGGSY